MATTIGVERLTEMTRNARSTEAQLVLKDLDLREVDFAAIERAVPGAFSGAEITRCDLSGADLSRAVFAGAEFHDCAMRGVIADRAPYPVVMRGVEFIGCDLRDARFRGAVLESAYFAESDLRRVRFDHANLTTATIRFCALTGAVF